MSEQENKGTAPVIEHKTHVFTETRLSFIEIKDIVNKDFYLHFGILSCFDARVVPSPICVLKFELRNYDDLCSFIEKTKSDLEFIKVKAKEVFDKQSEVEDD